MTAITTVAKKLGIILVKQKKTLAVAESCTGGMIGASITATPGSSRYFTGGVIAYNDGVKRKLLKVPASVLRKSGAVSGATVSAMADGARKLFRADAAVAVSGIAGPGGGTRAKPVGLVYIGVAAGKTTQAYEYRFKGSRQRIREQCTEQALRRLIEQL